MDQTLDVTTVFTVIIILIIILIALKMFFSKNDKENNKNFQYGIDLTKKPQINNYKDDDEEIIECNSMDNLINNTINSVIGSEFSFDTDDYSYRTIRVNEGYLFIMDDNVMSFVQIQNNLNK